jgi:hypothetical protein
VRIDVTILIGTPDRKPSLKSDRLLVMPLRMPLDAGIAFEAVEGG